MAVENRVETDVREVSMKEQLEVFGRRLSIEVMGDNWGMNEEDNPRKIDYKNIRLETEKFSGGERYINLVAVSVDDLLNELRGVDKDNFDEILINQFLGLALNGNESWVEIIDTLRRQRNVPEPVEFCYSERTRRCYFVLENFIHNEEL